MNILYYGRLFLWTDNQVMAVTGDQTQAEPWAGRRETLILGRNRSSDKRLKDLEVTLHNSMNKWKTNKNAFQYDAYRPLVTVRGGLCPGGSP